MLSISQSNSFDPKFHRFFDTASVHTIEDFTRVITKQIWSPIIWQGGVRRRDQFLSCKYAALDFDTGEWTLADARAFAIAEGLSAIIGTSKSHQKAKTTPTGKVSPPVDRFRLVIPFQRLIEDRLEYEATMRQLAGRFPCDPSCVDAARFFYPCREIYFWQVIPGTGLAIDPAARAVLVEELSGLEQRQTATWERSKATGILPAWILAVLRFGVPESASRHHTCYRLGANLIQMGWAEERIVEAVMKSPLAAIGRADVTRAVLNGAQKSREGRAQRG